MIVIAEGEKDVNNLWNIGIPASCNWEGAGRWGDDLTPTFADADVCIIADNDEPGRKHANNVAAKLNSVAKRVRVLDLVSAWSQCPEKGDITDWIKQTKGTAEQLYALIEKVPDWQPKPTQTALTLRFDWEAAQPQPMGTIVRGLLHRGSLTLFYGPPKSGKSFLVTSIFLAIAADDKEWMDHQIVRSGPVLYVACEGHAGFWKRLKAAAISRVWNEDTFPKNFVLATGRPHLIRLNDKTHAAAPHPDDVLAAIAEAKAKGCAPLAVAIDTVFRSIGAGNVNASDHMNAYLAALAAVADQNIALAAVHHETKSGGTPAGSVTLIGGADTIVATANLDDGAHSWHVEAAKDDAVTEPRKFRLPVVPVGADPDGEEVSSCIIEPVTGPVVKTKTKALTGEHQAFREILMDAFADARNPIVVPEAGMPRVIAVTREFVRRALIRKGWFHEGLLSTNSDNVSVLRRGYQNEYNALRALKDRKIIAFNREHVWLIQ